MIRKCFLAVSLAITFCSLNYASEIMVPATQIRAGGGIFELYFTRQSKTLNFHVSSRDQIKAGQAGSYFSDVSNDIESPGQSSAILAKYTANPNDNLNYWFKAGSGYYNLEFPGTSQKSTLNGRDLGNIFGAGLKKRMFPDTIVSPAISAEIGLEYASFDLDSFASGGTSQVISDKLELCEAQAAVMLSKKFAGLECYGGLKVQRTYSFLWDKTTVASVSGIKDNVGLFAGARISPYKNEALVVEAGLYGETGVSIGWSIEF